MEIFVIASGSIALSDQTHQLHAVGYHHIPNVNIRQVNILVTWRKYCLDICGPIIKLDDATHEHHKV